NHFVHVNPLSGNVFVSAGTHHYFYGNFHGTNFHQWGLQPWSQFAMHSYDPIFAHERIANWGNPNWLSGAQSQGLSGVNTPNMLTCMTQSRTSGMQFSQLTAQQRQTQMQNASQLTSQSQQFSQQNFRNLSQVPTSVNRFSTSPSMGNFASRTSNFQPALNTGSLSGGTSMGSMTPRTSSPNISFNGQSWANRPATSLSNSGMSRPSFSSQSFSRPSFGSSSFSRPSISSSSFSSGSHGSINGGGHSGGHK